MSAQPIGPGSIVVCLNAQLNEYLPAGYRLTPGALYCVEEIRHWYENIPCRIDDCPEGFILKGKTTPVDLTNAPGRVFIGYCPSQFRPLNDGDTSLVEKEQTDDANGAGLQTYRRVLEPTS